MKTEGIVKQDTGDRMNAGYRIPDTGYSILEDQNA
jgi:hypothetical protein